ncbi:MAG: 3-hydroxyacyl-CoA dehydrogenase [Verrucomicrobia bacterium]|nr:3-hydroxyacyl-CoA dehydrogenase [Verrucomicrobiota bacterium]
MERKIALIGAGLVGRGWAIVFARAGFQVALFDGEQRALDEAPALIAQSLKALAEYGLVEDPGAVRSRIRPVQTLVQALEGAEYVQESVFEQVDAKRMIFAAMDEAVDAKTLIGSSSSGIPASAFTEFLWCRERCLIAHPINPPYLVPVVELVPAPWTAPSAVATVRALMADTGQVPVVVNREIEGFLINRLQGMLLMEAWRLVEEGYATVEDVDRTVKDGLGLRWSFMGPFETIDLNAPGGVADYARRLGPLFQRVAASRAEHRVWSPESISEVERQRRAILAESALPERMAWRDRRLMAVAVHKKAES